MGKVKIFVVGSGKLANAIALSDMSFSSHEIARWETRHQDSQEQAILVHAGSGRQLEECFEFCSRTRSTFIELSTGSGTEKMNPCFPLIICPNTSILLLKALHMMKANGRHFEGYQISITESHQSAKKTEPGTAYAFANALKFPLDKITSIRDPAIQRDKIGIPQEYLDKHAYHKIVIKDGCDELTLETKVLGHDSYAKGVKTIIGAVIKNTLENKRYTVLDLLDTNIL